MQISPQLLQEFPWRSAVRARYAALPPEHGAWVFLLSPLSIGLALGGLRPASVVLLLAALSAFLVRQPVTILVKIYSGRRPKSEWRGATFWLLLYGVVGLLSVAVLVAWGYAYLFWLALPAVPIFAWHLWLVSRRAERRQMGIEIVAGGVLALAAPAAFWVGQGRADLSAFLLWALCWAQVAGTILYAYLRLEQRPLKAMPSPIESLRMAAPPLIFNLGLLVVVAGMAMAGLVPPWLPIAYLVQPIEAAWGTARPAVGVKPKVIGIRQLIVSSLFTLLFILISLRFPA